MHGALPAIPPLPLTLWEGVQTARGETNPEGEGKGMSYTREMRRRTERVHGRALLEQIKHDAFVEGSDAALTAIIETLRVEFGFGGKRIERLREGVERRLGSGYHDMP